MTSEERKVDSLERLSTGLSPRKIYEEVSKTVVGQEAAKKAVCNAVFLHFVRYCQSVHEQRDIKKSNLLLMGPTGCGKTFLVKEAAKAIRKLTGYPVCPVLEVDCTELTSRGWEGDDITALIKSHYKEHGMNEAAFNSSIVFLDEFDKLCKPAISKSGVDHNRQTQYNLLKVIEGTDISGSSNKKIRTHKMLFIMAGNFSEVRALRDQKERVMGFRSVTEEEKYVDYHTEVENAGMATQLVGRTPHIAELYELQPEELQVILDDHLLPEVQSTWEYMGRELQIEKEQAEKMVLNCYKRKTGARGLMADLAKHVEEEVFDMEFKL